MDCPKDAVLNEFVAAFYEGQKIDPAAVPASTREHVRGQVAELVPAYTPEQVRRCVSALTTEPYWGGRLDDATGLLRMIPTWSRLGEPQVWPNEPRANGRHPPKAAEREVSGPFADIGKRRQT